MYILISQRQYEFLCQSSAANLNFNLLWRIEVHDKTLRQTVNTNAEMLWLQLLLESSDHFAEFFASKFIVQIIWSLKCGLKWMATINRLMIYASVVDIFIVSVAMYKEKKEGIPVGNMLKMQITEYVFNSLSGKEILRYTPASYVFTFFGN